MYNDAICKGVGSLKQIWKGLKLMDVLDLLSANHGTIICVQWQWYHDGPFPWENRIWGREWNYPQFFLYVIAKGRSPEAGENCPVPNSVDFCCLEKLKLNL